MNISISKPRNKNILLTSILLFLFLIEIYFVSTSVIGGGKFPAEGIGSIGVDWNGCFRVAALRVLNGQNAYPVMQNPPWILLLTIPIALLPPVIGTAVMFTLTFFGYGLACYRLGIKPFGMLAFLLLLPVWYCAMNGNIDWLIAIGFTLPPQIGLFFILLKPQLGIAVMLFWSWQAWKQGGIKKVIHIFLPVTCAFLLSFFIFGFWPLTVISERLVDPFNASAWPLTASLGIALLYFACRNDNEHLAISASPFLTPYLTFHGYAIAFLGLDTLPLSLSVGGFWAAFLFKLL